MDWSIFLNDLLIDSGMVKVMQNYDDDKTKEIERDAKTTADEAKETLDGARDRIKAGTKAVGNKLIDPDRDLDTEYDKEKIKENLT